MALKSRLLEVSIALASNQGTNQPISFESGADTVTMTGLRTSVRVQNAGTPVGGAAQIVVYGMAKSLMDQLSTLGVKYSLIERNTVSVRAGDEEDGMSLVFTGTILNAYPDYNAAPEVGFRMECQAGLAEMVISAAASSYTGQTDVGTIMSDLAAKMGRGFENSGVTAQLSTPYLPGTLMQQVEKVRRDAGIEAVITPDGVLAIWPRGGARGGEAPLVAPPPEGGMQGYPMFTASGIEVTTLWDRRIGRGGQVVVRGSDQERANGTWNVFRLEHQLDSLLPKGRWHSVFNAFNPNSAAPAPVSPRSSP